MRVCGGRRSSGDPRGLTVVAGTLVGQVLHKFQAGHGVGIVQY